MLTRLVSTFKTACPSVGILLNYTTAVAVHQQKT